jgi:hypothetical protein
MIRITFSRYCRSGFVGGLCRCWRCRGESEPAGDESAERRDAELIDNVRDLSEMGKDRLRRVLIRFLWRSIEDGADCVCDEGCEADDPAPECAAWRALGYGDHWPGTEAATERLAKPVVVYFYTETRREPCPTCSRPIAIARPGACSGQERFYLHGPRANPCEMSGQPWRGAQ